MTTSKKTIEIGTDHVKNAETMSNISMNPSPGFAIPSMFHDNETCTFTGTNLDCKITDSDLKIDEGQDRGDSNRESCWADTSGPATGTVEIGIFKMAGGEAVAAKKTHRTYSQAKIVCEKQGGERRDAGLGSTDMIEVETAANRQRDTKRMWNGHPALPLQRYKNG